MVAKKINYDDIFAEDLQESKSSEMEQLLEDSTANKGENLSASNIIKGTVVAITDEGVSVDVGLKSEGFLEKSEFKNEPKIGDEVDVVVVRTGKGGAYIKLSHKKAEMIKEWDSIITAAKEETSILAKVTKSVKGGYIVKFNYLDAFLPFRESGTRNDDIVDKTVNVKILTYNKKAGKIIASRKAYTEEIRNKKKLEQKDQLTVGTKMTVTVTNIVDYGIFVDTGAYDGFIHISDLAWGHLTHPNKAVKLGEEIEAVVTKYDAEKDRLTLSRKEAMSDPWELILNKYHIGDRVTGTVTKLLDFGAFVELEPGIEGLIHVSEMSWTERINSPKDILSKGNTVETMIIEINKEKKRLSLGLKQIKDNPYEKLLEETGIGGKIKVTVKSMNDKGIVVTLPNDLEGFIRVNDLAWKDAEAELSKYKEQDEIEVSIVDIQARKSQIYLGIKQLTDDPWNTVKTKYKENKIVTAKVIKVIDMGAVLELEAGVEGFLNAKEMENKSKKPKEAYKIDDELRVVIQRIDHKRHRIQLSERLVQKLEEAEAVKTYLGDKQEDVKTSLADFFQKN